MMARHICAHGLEHQDRKQRLGEYCCGTLHNNGICGECCRCQARLAGGRRCWRVRSTDLDGKYEDGMDRDKEDIEPHLCCFELLSENGLMFSESRRKGSKSGQSRHPASDVGRPCVNEMDTDREEIENEED